MKRRACRPWLAERFERLPALASDKRLHWQRQSRRQAIQARICLMQHLRAMFGHEVRAWRQGLDREGHFAVDRTQLFCFCRQADLDVDLNALWRGMDQDGDGFFTMEEFDPQRALALAGLRSWCHKSFGSCAALWTSRQCALHVKSLRKVAVGVHPKSWLLVSFYRC